MTPLGRALAERIRNEGPLSVEAYMEACNAYYYATRDPLGASGDFTTAPEIHQMFGELIGAALADVWTRAGKPEQTVYAELGPGRGTLANDALRVMRRSGFEGEVHLIETSQALREVQAKLLPEAIFHETIDDLPAAPLLLVANEFFDALPVRQYVDGRERHVILAAGGFAFDRDGPIVERSPAREEAAERLAGHLSAHGGAAIIIDYGYSGGEQGDTLQAVRSHKFSYVLDHPGEQDLTAHVDFA
ncbi:MAG TPA: SAM-dependent methyltransferase, partial [Sphingomicrobium sp.]|nr:SAM-dependent methyltransferase [Sphingomicrobium sp.]